MLLNPISIVKLQKLPPEFQKNTQEPNLLEYKDHEILVALEGEEVIGSVRLALRTVSLKSGLITDLGVDKKHQNRGLEEKLVKSAEVRLKELKVKEVDGVCRDGIGHVRYFYRSGYKPFRRTVFVEWDLAQLLNLEVSNEYLVKVHLRSDRMGSSEVEEVILNSLQPYWTPWKDPSFIRQPMDFAGQEKQKRLKEKLDELFKDKTYRVFIAYQNGKALGLVDARKNQSNLVFGVAIRKDFKGRRLGSTLLCKALGYLKKLDLKKAAAISTSGLDDYDPQIYLYTLSGGKIVKEYIDLKKTL